MASYNLNEVLKKKKKGGSETNGEVKLDDVSRVKVLSPTMQVFKRFIRFSSYYCSLCFLFLRTSLLSIWTEADLL